MKSIRRHLVVWQLSWLATLCVIGVVAFVLAAKRSLVADFDRSLVPELANAQLLLRPGPLGFNNPENRGVRVYIQAWDFDTENTLYKSPNLERRTLPFLAVRPRRNANANATLDDGEFVRIAATGIVTFAPRDDESVGNAVVVAVAKDRFSLERSVRRLIGLASLVGGLGTLGAVGIAWIVLEKGLRPLDQLGEEADRIDPDTLDTRLNTEGLAEELEPFARRINGLLQRLESAFERERQFGADLSHELRTPIAEIRATAEFAQLYPDRASHEDYESILATTRRLQSIVEAQLALARIDSGAPATEAAIDLAEMLRAGLAASNTAGVTVESGNPIELSGPGQRLVSSNRERLAMVVGNLIGNAVSHSPKGSRIGVEVGEEGDPLWFRIVNDAPDLSEDDLSRLFDRLWRKDLARGDGHSGLGLSIALAAARSIGLRIEASLESGSLSMTVREESSSPAETG